MHYLVILHYIFKSNTGSKVILKEIIITKKMSMGKYSIMCSISQCMKSIIYNHPSLTQFICKRLSPSLFYFVDFLNLNYSEADILNSVDNVVILYIPIYKWFFGMIIDDCVVCNSSCGNFANLSLNQRYIYCIKKICPCKKKTHISILVLQYHIEIQCHIKLAVCLHIFLKGYLRLFHLALLELSTKELHLQIKKLKSIWAQSFIKYFY